MEASSKRSNHGICFFFLLENIGLDERYQINFYADSTEIQE